MNYKTKIAEATARIYAQNRSIKLHTSNPFTKTINRKIEPPSKSSFINEDIDSLLLIAVSRFNLHSDFADRAKEIIFNMCYYPDNFHKIKVELVALAALKYVCNTDLYIEHNSIDFNAFIIDWFGTYEANSNIIHFNTSYEIIFQLYAETETQIELKELEARVERIKHKLALNRELKSNVDYIREKYNLI